MMMQKKKQKPRMNSFPEFQYPSLLKHLSVEFGYNIMRNKWSALNETRGYVSNLDMYLKIIDRKVYETTTDLKNGIVYEINLNETDFEDVPNKFFDTITMKIQFGVMCGEKIMSGAGYEPSESGISKDGKVHVSIWVDVSDTSYITAIEKLNVFVGHELIHARQDVAMLKRGKSISDEKVEGSYADSVRMASSRKMEYVSEKETECIRKLGRILYFLTPTEQNAFIGQCFSELVDKKEDIKDSITAYNTITKTKTFKLFEKVKKMLEELSEVKDGEIMYNLLVSYCENNGIDISKNPKLTYSWMISNLQKRTSNAFEHFFKRVSKMACDAYFQSRNYNPHAYSTLFMEEFKEDNSDFILETTNDIELAEKFKKKTK